MRRDSPERMIKLTSPGGAPIWFNPACIVAVRAAPRGEAGAEIFGIEGGESWYVQETPEQVITALESSQQK